MEYSCFCWKRNRPMPRLRMAAGGRRLLTAQSTAWQETGKWRDCLQNALPSVRRKYLTCVRIPILTITPCSTYWRRTALNAEALFTWKTEIHASPIRNNAQYLTDFLWAIFTKIFRNAERYWHFGAFSVRIVKNGYIIGSKRKLCFAFFCSRQRKGRLRCFRRANV